VLGSLNTPRRFVRRGVFVCTLLASALGAQSAQPVTIPAGRTSYHGTLTPARAAGARHPSVILVERAPGSATLRAALAASSNVIALDTLPVLADGSDGASAVEWVARQPWSDGAVALVASGAAASSAWLIAGARPAHLRTMVAEAPERLPATTSDVWRHVTMHVLSVGGTDVATQGMAVEAFARHNSSDDRAAKQHYLLVGPLGDDDRAAQVAAWVRYVLEGAARPSLLADKVNYLVLGDGSWRSVSWLSEIGARTVAYPLHTDAGPGTDPALGFLGDAAGDGEPTDRLADGRAYLTGPLAKPLDLAGRPDVWLWLTRGGSAPIEVTLEEVAPDGTGQLLGKSPGRLRTLVTDPASPSRWEFDQFAWIARKVKAGNRIRLRITGGTGETVLFHDRARNSRVVLMQVP
jgi:hypothetical protein